MMRSNKLWAVPALALLAACGGNEPAADATETQPGATAVEATTPAAPAAAEEATGQVIEVRMTMANGGRFEPSEVSAKPGDVIRFVNVENVHNVSFPQAKNGGAANLPASSPFLTAPGQTYDLKVDFGPGTYQFQCDPHAAMGMVGTLTVTE